MIEQLKKVSDDPKRRIMKIAFIIEVLGGAMVLIAVASSHGGKLFEIIKNQ
jgi:hypothetical protein